MFFPLAWDLRFQDPVSRERQGHPVSPGGRGALEGRLGRVIEALEAARAEFLNCFMERGAVILKIARALREPGGAVSAEVAAAALEVELALNSDRVRAPLDRLLGRLREASWGGAPRVRRVALLVEDDEALRLVVERVLVREGFTVETFEGPEAALAAGEGPYDLAVADVRAPSVRGKAFVRRLRRRPGQRETPVLILAVPEDSLGAPWGADAVLYKPFTPQEFVAVVRRLARRPAR